MRRRSLEEKKRRTSSRLDSSASPTLRFLLPSLSLSLSRSGDREDRPILVIISGGSVADRPRSSRTVLLKRASPCRTSCADLILVLERRDASTPSSSSGSAPNERSDLFLCRPVSSSSRTCVLALSFDPKGRGFFGEAPSLYSLCALAPALLPLSRPFGLDLFLCAFLLPPLFGRDPRPDRVLRVGERVDADLGRLDDGCKDGFVVGARFEFDFGKLEQVEERVARDAAKQGVLVLQFRSRVEREEESALAQV